MKLEKKLEKKLRKNDKILLVMELLFLVVYTISMCGGKKVYELNEETLELYNNNVIYSPADGSYTIQGDGTQAQESVMLGVARMEIAKGAYEVSVRYASDTGINGQTGNCDNRAGSLRIRSYKNPTDVGYNTIQLVDGDHVRTDRMWITSLRSVEDLDVKVYFNGYGTLRIERIVFSELFIWRVTCVLKWILIILAFNVLYFYFVRKNAYKDQHVLAALSLTVVFSSLLAFQDYVMGGHDLSFHLMRILSIGKSIAAGKWISPIHTDVANGYGYATPIFYGQIFLYIPAILYNMAVPLHICYQIYVVCVNIATCLVSYICFRAIVQKEEIVYKKEIALFGAYCYQMSAYRLIDVYIRGALGEYTAMIFLPLVLYGFYRVYTLEQERLSLRDTVCIVFGLTGIIQSHLITIELTALFVVAMCLGLYKKTFQPRRFLTLAGAAVLTLLCNLGFLLPLIDSMKMDIAVNAREMGNMQELGASMYQVFGMFMHPDETFTLGIGLVLGAAVFGWCFVKRYEWGLAGKLFMKAGTVALVMLVPAVLCSFSAFPWDSIIDAGGVIGALGQLVGVIQFPWRFHVISTILCVFLAVLGISVLCQCGRGKYAVAAGGVIVLLITLNAGVFFARYPEIAMTTRLYASMDGTLSIAAVSGGEYQLVGTDFELCKTKEVITEDETVVVSDYQSSQGETLFSCVNGSDQSRYVEIPVFCYDNYRAYDRESGDAVPVERGTNNRVRILVAGGYQGDLCVTYQIPVLWKISYLVSALTVIGIVGCLLTGRRFGGLKNE